MSAQNKSTVSAAFAPVKTAEDEERYAPDISLHYAGHLRCPLCTHLSLYKGWTSFGKHNTFVRRRRIVSCQPPIKYPPLDLIGMEKRWPTLTTKTAYFCPVKALITGFPADHFTKSTSTPARGEVFK